MVGVKVKSCFTPTLINKHVKFFITFRMPNKCGMRHFISEMFWIKERCNGALNLMGLPDKYSATKTVNIIIRMGGLAIRDVDLG